MVYLPLWKIWVRQIGSSSQRKWGKYKKCSKPPTRLYFIIISYSFQTPTNNVLLVKIEGPVWYTIYHHLPVVKGVSSNLSINQPTSGKRTSMTPTTNITSFSLLFLAVFIVCISWHLGYCDQGTLRRNPRVGWRAWSGCWELSVEGSYGLSPFFIGKYPLVN